MVRIRTSWLVATLAFGLAVTGCKKNDDKNSNDGRARSQWQVTGQSSPNGRITS